MNDPRPIGMNSNPIPKSPVTSWDISEQSAGKVLRPFGSAVINVGFRSSDRQSCPDCGFIWEACDCDLAPYRGAFETQGRN